MSISIFLPSQRVFLTVKKEILDWKAKRSSLSIVKETKKMANFCGLVFEVSVADFRRCFPFLRGFGQFSKKTCLVGSCIFEIQIVVNEPREF